MEKRAFTAVLCFQAPVWADFLWVSVTNTPHTTPKLPLSSFSEAGSWCLCSCCPFRERVRAAVRRAGAKRADWSLESSALADCCWVKRSRCLSAGVKRAGKGLKMHQSPRWAKVKERGSGPPLRCRCSLSNNAVINLLDLPSPVSRQRQCACPCASCECHRFICPLWTPGTVRCVLGLDPSWAVTTVRPSQVISKCWCVSVCHAQCCDSGARERARDVVNKGV